MACGTPVIVGNRASLPEVVGDAGMMVDPYDVEAIAAALMRLLTHADARNVFGARGRERAARFSWQDTADQTLAVLDRFGGQG